MINFNRSGYYYGKRDYDRALEIAKKATELDPNFADAHLRLLLIYGKVKRFDDARREAKLLAGLVKESFPQMLTVAETTMAYVEGDKERVRKLLPELETHLGEPAGPGAIDIAEFYFYIGEIDKGFEWVERAYSRNEYFLRYIKNDEFFDDVRGDARYQNILRKIGLE
jgi:tetratricopeptide (TPR) repeat protein